MTRLITLAGLVVLGVVTVAPTGADAAKRLIFEAQEIEGEVQRPQVSVYITRQNLNDPYDMELEESFLPKIVEAVEHPPF